MARGFESKDVEYQQAEAERTKRRAPAVSAAEQERLARRRALELSLARLDAELARARVPAHRQMLEAAAADLRRELDALSS